MDAEWTGGAYVGQAATRDGLHMHEIGGNWSGTVGCTAAAGFKKWADSFAGNNTTKTGDWFNLRGKYYVVDAKRPELKYLNNGS